MKNFNSISDGCVYFEYIQCHNSEIEIQCELQNT